MWVLSKQGACRLRRHCPSRLAVVRIEPGTTEFDLLCRKYDWLV